MKTQHLHASQIKIDIFWTKQEKLTELLNAVELLCRNASGPDFEIPDQSIDSEDITEQYRTLGVEFLKFATVEVYDNGGESLDQYTVILKEPELPEEVYGMDERGMFDQYCGELSEIVKDGSCAHFGKKLTEIPECLVRRIRARLEDETCELRLR